MPHAVIVLQEQREVLGLIRAERVHVEASARGVAEQERGEVLAQRSGSGIVQRAAHEVLAELIISARIAIAGGALAVFTDVRAELQRVATPDLGEVGENLKNVERGEVAATIADVGK